jgi:acid phosphatase (class A)
MTILKRTRNTVLAFCLTAVGFAQFPGKTAKRPVFISSGLVEQIVLISPPPAIDSQTLTKAVAEIYEIHRSANAQEIERANWDNEHEGLFAIARVLRDNINKESMPATARLWADMDNDQGIFVSAAKLFFQEPRPYDLDSTIKSFCGSKPGGSKGSYPSGHGTVGYLSALVLSMMAPEKTEVLRARADEYGHNRVVCGDHYSSDILASKEAAEILIGNMISDRNFQAEFAAAKAEVREALGLQR